MKNIDIVQILICILSSSFLSVIVSTIFLDPIRERRKYIFDEKKEYMIQLLFLLKYSYIQRRQNFH